MQNHKVSLKLWRASRIVPALALFAVYHFSVQPSASFIRELLQWVFLVMMIGSLLLLSKKRDVIDESAKEILKKTDYFCLRVFYILSAFILVLILLYIDDAKIIGYFIAGEVVVITACRIVLFWVFDSCGVE